MLCTRISYSWTQDHTEGDGEGSVQGVASRVQEGVYGDTREGSGNFAGMAQPLR